MAATLSSGFRAESELTALTDRLARACMEQRGFKIHQETREQPGRTSLPYENADIEIAMTARQVVDEDRVSEVGYGRSPREMLGFDPSAVAAPGHSAFAALPRAEQNRYWKAYQGYTPDEVSDVPAGDADTQVALPNQESFTLPDGERISYPREGCSAQVQQAMFEGKVREFHELSHYARQGVARAAIGDVRADPEVLERNRRWSRCMQRKRHDGLGEPTDANNRASTSYGARVFGPSSPGFAALKKKEIALATADYACNHEVGLDETRVRVFWRNVARVCADRETQIKAWQELVAAALVRGQALLAHRPWAASGRHAHYGPA